MSNPMMVEVDERIYAEFEYMSELMKRDGRKEMASEIIAYVLASIADGSRRPGAWERQMLVSMGLVSEQPEHHVYRDRYGKPE